MDSRTHRPQRGFGRSERSLAKIAEELTRFLTKAQRSLTYDTLHLSGRQRETLASLLVECAEDLSHDIGIWRSLEAYNRDFFGTPLPCVLQPDEAMDVGVLDAEEGGDRVDLAGDVYEFLRERNPARLLSATTTEVPA